ncbi:MAG: SlyX family protein [Phycisphaerales bacterium]
MDDQAHDRLTRLEESQAFLERATEQLHEELLTMARRVDALTSRLAKAEAALAERPVSQTTDVGGDAEPTPEFELPPHAHRPVDRHAGRTTDPFGPTGDPPDTVR